MKSSGDDSRGASGNDMAGIEFEQLRLIEESRRYIDTCRVDGVNVGESELCRICVWAPGPSKRVFDSLRGTKFSFAQKLLCLLEAAVKPTYHVVTSSNPTGSSDLVVVAWVLRENFTADGFHNDRYFGVSSRDDLSITWVLLSADGFVPDQVASNVRLIVPKQKALFGRLAALFRLLWMLAKCRGGTRSRSWHEVLTVGSPAEVMTVTIVPSLAATALDARVLLAYEAQGYHHGIVQRLRTRVPGVRVIGYFHSALPPLPTDVLYRDGAPDVLLVNGSGQAQILVEHLDWPTACVRAIPALRYREGVAVAPSGEIYLPYTLGSVAIWATAFGGYLESLPPASLSPLRVRNHPIMLNSSAHLRFSETLNNLLAQYADRFSTAPDARCISIFFGITAANLECLEAGISVVQISDDPVTELRTHALWDGLRVRRVADNVFEYELLHPNSYIKRSAPGRKLRDVLALAEV